MSLDPLLESHWIIQVHALAALVALGLGVILIAAPKGALPHRTLGWAFAGLMIAVAVSAVGIAWLKDWRFSWIHAFVPLVFYAVITGLLRARRRNVTGHRTAMRGLFFGALVVPGIVAFAIPGRVMHAVVFG